MLKYLILLALVYLVSAIYMRKGIGFFWAYIGVPMLLITWFRSIG